MLAVLGLTDPGDGNWARLRGLQYSSLGSAMTARTAIQAAAMLATALMMAGQVHPTAILVWVIVVTATLWRGYRVDRALAAEGRRRLSRDDVHAQMVIAAVNGLAWAAPLACFGLFVNSQTEIKIWTVLAMLMAASAILLPAVPMSTLLFSGIVGGSAVVYFLFSGTYDMAALAAFFLVTVLAGSIAGARRYVATKIAEAGMLEKDEVVSLLLREFEEGEADWLWQIDTARRVRSVSRRFAYALGREASEVEGMSILELIAGPDWESGQFSSSLRELAERFKRRESFSDLLVRATIRGEQRWWELSGTPKFDESGAFEGFRGVGSDVTEARESSDKIAYLARYDTLTGLPNRMMLTDSLGEALGRTELRGRCAFMMIDLDRFKAVNDTLGHLVGDRLLAEVSERLAGEMREHEMCGRLGGDEFAIIIPSVANDDHVDRVAERVILRLSQPYEIEHNTLFIGASIGSAVGPRDGSTVETLMHNADLALYRSKDMGGNVHCRYEPALHADAEQRRALELSLRQAVDAEEFGLVYQPVVDARTAKVVAFEALLRWNSKAYGSVSPARFLAIAEETRLIVPIGEWVLREACRQAMNWPPQVRVAVNISCEQLLDSNFDAAVVGALSQSGLPATRLEIEVTEGVFVRDAALARAAIERVMALGCHVALDDFGTGYSSLDHVRKLRFSTLKIDRVFVEGAATGNPESVAIIRAAVAMADSLGMVTTAEGAETRQEVEVLRALGCGRIQGNYFGRPIEGPVSESLFREVAGKPRQTAA